MSIKQILNNYILLIFNYLHMKKYVVLGIGITMMLFGMGLNLHYALDDYGLGNKNVAITVMAQTTKTGDDGSGTWEKACKDCNVAGGAGATSCSCDAAQFGFVIDGKGRSCNVSTASGYYSCCRINDDGSCSCPSCVN